jgi:hypothetical protein
VSKREGEGSSWQSGQKLIKTKAPCLADVMQNILLFRETFAVEQSVFFSFLFHLPPLVGKFTVTPLLNYVNSYFV